MMSGNNISWTVLSLDDVASFQNGGAWKESEYEESGVPVVRVTNCKGGTIDLNDCKYLNPASFEKYSKHELSQGDVVIATVGSHPTQPNSVVGRSSIVPHKAAGSLLNQNAVRLRAKKGIFNQKLLGYISQSGPFKQYIAAHARGAASQVRMSIELLKKMPIKVPPLGTQESIASILSAYDDLIENNTRRIEILEEMARRLYEEWFVNFRFPGHEEVSFKESELGAIPEGWEVVSLSKLVSTQYGYTESATQEPVGPRFLRGMDINKKSYIDWASVPYCPVDEKARKKFCLSLGDILIIRMADPGKVGIVEKEVDAVFASYLVRLSIADERLTPYYLFYYLTGSQYQDYITGASTGTTRKSASAKVITGVPIAIPPDDLLAKFEAFISPLRRQLSILVDKSSNLRAQRDLLLPKLVSGEIDVSDISVPDDKEIEAA